MTLATLLSVHTGRIAPLGPDQVPSAFIKHKVSGPVGLGPLGLAGDEQADLSVHGGPEKAVYAYAAAHYPMWRAEFPEHETQFVPGGVGENLAVDGMDETMIHVGDIHAIGTALLQVCQPRQPCFKFALRFNDNRLPKAMVRSARSGWYYRVIAPGIIRAGDTIALHERPNPDFAFTRFVEIVYRGNATEAEWARLAEMPGVASQWQTHARTVLNPLGQ
ncbi:MAG: MOSC domain-containing protein [Methylovirgula sp.]